MKKKPDFDLSSTFENMKEAGIQLKLYCARTKEEQLWNLLYNMAYVADRSDLCVLGMNVVSFSFFIIIKSNFKNSAITFFIVNCSADYTDFGGYMQTDTAMNL